MLPKNPLRVHSTRTLDENPWADRVQAERRGPECRNNRLTALPLQY